MYVVSIFLFIIFYVIFVNIIKSPRQRETTLPTRTSRVRHFSYIAETCSTHRKKVDFSLSDK